MHRVEPLVLEPAAAAAKLERFKSAGTGQIAGDGILRFVIHKLIHSVLDKE
jgi:hypothetical protein